MADTFVIDSNFFISLAHTRVPSAIETAIERALALGCDLHTTTHIVREVSTVRSYRSRRTARDLAMKSMTVTSVAEGDIARLRSSLGGATHAPQGPDLSLMVLAGDLARHRGGVKLVSDDFKISTSSRELNMPYSVISPSVFLFSITRRLRGKERDEVRRLYRKVRHSEMEYLLSRRDLYNVEDKLNWLMDNLLHAVTAQGAAVQRPAPPPQAAAAEGPPGGQADEWHALVRHLRGERVRHSHLRPYKDVLPQMEPLTRIRTALEGIHQMSREGDLEGALGRAHRELSDQKSHLQLAVGNFDRERGQLVLRAYAELLPDLEMVTALLHVNLGEVIDCEDHLDNVALLALAAGLPHIILDANYLEAMVHVYREAWSDAMAQFDLTARLSAQMGEASTELRCMVGIAITEFLSGSPEAAERTMERVNERVEADPAAGSVALEEFGDHFTNFGAIHLASGLYDEALECAVEAKDTEGAERLLGKLRRAHLSMGNEEREVASALGRLIDHANDIQDDGLRERYEELERQLTRTEEAMDEPLTGLLPEWSSAWKLPEPLRGWLDVVRAEPLPEDEGTTIVCYSPDIGTVGLLLRSGVNLPGIEQARVRVGEESRVKLVEAPEPLRSRHRLRGLVVLHEDDPFELQRMLVSLRA